MKNIVFLFLLLPAMVFAQQPESLVHNLKLYVDDYADIFSDQEEIQLDGVIRKFFDTVQISIVTIKSFGDIAPTDYALRLGRKWGVGGQSNNGLLIVIGVEDRHIEVATGPGVEGDLPDIRVVQLQRELAVPRFKQKEYFEGAFDLLNGYINELSPSAKALRAKEEETRKQQNQIAWENTRAVLFNILIALAILSLIALPFYFKWRKLKKQREEEEIKNNLLKTKEAAEAFLKEHEPPDELLKKYPHKSTDILAYKSSRDNIQLKLNSNSLFDFTTLVFIASNYYRDIFYVQPAYSNIYSGSENKKNSYDSDSSSSSSYNSYNSGGSYNSSSDDSSSSSFGGGSFSGGGGGSDW